MLTLGTGIGGGLLIDGRIYRGAVGAAAELGHMVIEADGPPCQGNCPNHGCLEALASGTALAREGLRVAHGAPDSGLGRALAAGREITGALITELAHDGDPASRDVIALIGTRLGVGISNLVNIFNPEAVIIGGGVIAAGELLLGRRARSSPAARSRRRATSCGSCGPGTAPRRACSARQRSPSTASTTRWRRDRPARPRRARTV